MKNTVLKAITATAGITFCVAGCLLDSEYWIPAIIATMLTGSWLLAFAYANGLTK